MTAPGITVLSVESRLEPDGTIKRAIALADGITRQELSDVLDTIISVYSDNTFWVDDVFTA